MLVLSRKPGESIVIAEEIVVKIVDVDRNKVRLGIVAPRGIDVHRSEVFVSIYGRDRLDNLFAGVVS